MNVLILTPDAVGSTLLQRLITIYMQFHNYDRPVINLHELTNGLVKYYNQNFDQEVLGKKDGSWGYHQSLEQVVQLLSSVDHYKTSRLAHYHIRRRRDTLADQISFYQYLNDNFYIISCRRHNIFEHALSWCLSKVTKKLNVYNDGEKINSFFELYRDGIDLDPNSLLQTLNAYRDYVLWVNDHFNVANYFYYEEHVPSIEKYILNLPIFGQQTQKLTWHDRFGMDFDQWNLCHYLGSDLGTLALSQPDKFAQLSDQTRVSRISNDANLLLSGYQRVADPSWPTVSTIEEYQALPEHIRKEVEERHGVKFSTGGELVSRVELPKPLIELLPEQHQNYLNHHRQNYKQSMDNIGDMVNQGVIVSAPPIKKQTFAEKKHIIKNYQHLLQVYNQWIEKNPDMGHALDENTLDQFAAIETARWTPTGSELVVSAEQNIH
jgi:hypothetical protein